MIPLWQSQWHTLESLSKPICLPAGAARPLAVRGRGKSSVVLGILREKSSMLRISCVIAVLLIISVFALGRAVFAAESWQDVFQRKTYRNADGQSLLYRLMEPEKIEPGKRYPLVLFLHGAGERGSDNASQLVHGAGDFAKPENRQKYPCFVLAPQCPADGRWVDIDWNLPAHTMPKEPSVPMKLALELVDKLVAELPVDKERIYMTGLSMGGFGTWDAIQRRPELFAAALPICGGGDTAQAPRLKNLPLWAFHGEKDSVVPTHRTTDMIEAIRKAGGNPKMTIYPGVDHNSWSATYADPAVMAWLFGQKK
jgi:predicted peptidase